MEGKMAKDLIQQKKIKCVWGPPLDTNGATESRVIPIFVVIIILTMP